MIEHFKPSKPRKVWTLRPEVLLHPNVPKPMHGVAPRVILGRAWWDATRKAAYASTDYHCVACGVHKTCAAFHRWLEGHELYEIDYRRGRMTYVETVPLCHACHAFIHCGRLKAMLDKGEVTKQKHDEIMAHGRRALREAGLRKRTGEDEVKLAAWHRWRLVLDGAEHPPKFKSLRDWMRGHGLAEE